MNDSGKPPGARTTADIFTGLRNQILSLATKDVAGTPLPSGVFGALMEFTTGQTWVSLIAVLDGTTSLYFGSGGGIIGAGKSEIVRKANHLFLETASRFISSFTRVTEYPLPKPDYVHFYVLTSDGVYASEELDQSELDAMRSNLTPLYAAAQNVITQIRLVQGAQKR